MASVLVKKKENDVAFAANTFNAIGRLIGRPVASMGNQPRILMAHTDGRGYIPVPLGSEHGDLEFMASDTGIDVSLKRFYGQIDMSNPMGGTNTLFAPEGVWFVTNTTADLTADCVIQLPGSVIPSSRIGDELKFVFGNWGGKAWGLDANGFSPVVQFNGYTVIAGGSSFSGTMKVVGPASITMTLMDKDQKVLVVTSVTSTEDVLFA